MSRAKIMTAVNCRELCPVCIMYRTYVQYVQEVLSDFHNITPMRQAFFDIPYFEVSRNRSKYLYILLVYPVKTLLLNIYIINKCLSILYIIQ